MPRRYFCKLGMKTTLEGRGFFLSAYFLRFLTYELDGAGLVPRSLMCALQGAQVTGTEAASLSDSLAAFVNALVSGTGVPARDWT
jgi:hypothetical protein